MLGQFRALIRRKPLHEAPPAGQQPDNTAFNLRKAEKRHAAWLKSRKLCWRCKKIFRNWHHRDDWGNNVPSLRHHNIADLQRSARSCPICELLFHDLDKSILSRSLLKDQIVRVKSAGLVDVWGDIGTYFVSSTFNSSVHATFNCYRSGSVNRSTNSNASWNLVKEWFNNCEECHESCGALVSERKLPTRLVFVGADDSQLRLSLSQELPKETKYLTLSHCWGGKKFTTLSSENIKEFQSNIPIESLTKTFKDATVITRKLGFRYIWIDSLCIKQDDDKKDWKYEAPLMEQVYANSSLNIAASDSANGDTGCFFERPTSKVLGWKVWSGKDSGKEVWDCAPFNWVWTRFKDNPLGGRAWVHQERALSPRTLHFGAQELAWECRQRRTTETFPVGFGAEFLTTPGSAAFTASLWNDQNRSHILSRWNTIVESYSVGKLSVPTDKLVAISGLSRRFASTFGITYLAGLWKEDLLLYLLWRIGHSNRRPKQHRSEALRAPTWSWASTDSPVWYPSFIRQGHNELLATVAEVAVDSAPDPFVDFKRGYVKLKTDMSGHGLVLELEQQQIYAKFGAKILGETLMSALVYPDYQDHDIGGDVFYLPILRNRMEGYVVVMWGLILQPSIAGDFERVGSFRIDEEDLDAFQCALKEAASLDSHLFERFTEVDEDGNRAYTITII
ncbi:hypothetical protein G7Y89_g1261 [Cudoniella acicularis]|uniref:Heterokaryon incompatibility domain-containing protein n=1 Tax=Cudoniella acicularis TaxID=354080 RepID=A0A8H4RWQ7_9HELO|nr:hypothetical protein G7Y89_g1261 [Cudoniella acicularis]